MKRLISILLLLAFTLPAFAIVDDGEAMYLGGTAVGVKEGATGKFDTTQADTLNFVYKDGKLQIPYAKVTSFQYERKRARHLGIAPTIAVAMVKHLQRRHFFTIDYKDEKGVPQTAVFEVSKDMPQTLEAVLRVRSPRNAARPQPPCYNPGCLNYVPPCNVSNTCAPRADVAPAPHPPVNPAPNAAPMANVSQLGTQPVIAAPAAPKSQTDATATAANTPSVTPAAPGATQIPRDEFPEWMRWDD